MKILRLILGVTLVSLLFTQCRRDLFDFEFIKNHSHENGGHNNSGPHGMFKVTVENVSIPYMYFESGTEGSGPAAPGQSFTIKFHAGKGHKLSFATMYGFSNDCFYAPDEEGIELFNGDTPLTGDITSMIHLWDAGTEENQAPGPANMHDGADQNNPVMSIMDVNDGYDYGTVAGNLKVMLDYDGTSMFTLTIENQTGSTTGISPVAWVVHSDMQKPLFEVGSLDYGHGLELLAETGNPTDLGSYLEMNSGYVSPIAPGVWVVHHKGNKPIFKDDKPDYGEGLEMLAEMGDPTTEYNSLMAKGYETGIYNTKVVPSDGPLFPGESYTFTFKANVGDYLSFASMLGKSNDLFFAPGDMGVGLFNGYRPLSGDITDKVMLWDAGTEVNEYPGAGIHQGAPEGPDEMGNVMLVNDGFSYPDVNKMIKVTIMPY